MKLDGVVGVLQRVACQDQDDRLARVDLALLTELLEPRERDGRCRLTAQAFGAQLCLGDRDFSFGDVKAPAIAFLYDARGLAPRSWIANADRSGARMSLHRLQYGAVVFSDAPDQGVGSGRLNDRDARHARDKLQLFQFAEALAQRGAVPQIPAGDDDVIRHVPVEGLRNLERRGL